MNDALTVSTKPPATLDGWRQCAADLQQRQHANHGERQQLAQKRQAWALAAARGDTTAQRQIARLADREVSLQLVATSLDQGLAVAAQEIGSREALVAQENREAAIVAFRGKLSARLALVATIEQQIRDIAPLLGELATVTAEIEETHASLGGERSVLPPLAQESVGGRLAEFMAGRGFADWLPVARPEIRPAIGSWIEAEQAAQKSYQLPA